MDQAARLDECLQRWREARDHGRALSVDEVCHDCPELADDLARLIQVWEADSQDNTAVVRVDDEPQEDHTLTLHPAELSGAQDVTLPPREADQIIDPEEPTLPPSPQDAHLRPRTKILPRREENEGRAPDTIAHISETPAPTSMPSHAGRYRIDSQIARGGMGAVYRALDPDLNRTLAVKVMLRPIGDSRDTERRFLEEARITSRLQHPGIAPVHEVGRLDDGRPFFAMKLIKGRTLALLLKDRAVESENYTDSQKTPADLAKLVRIFEQICQTLAYAHSQNVIHRDLKPDNMMVGAFGEVQVMDWGLAKQIRRKAEKGQSEKATLERQPRKQNATTDRSQEKIRVTAQSDSSTTTTTGGDAGFFGGLSPYEPDGATIQGEIMGTPAYMAPEQARGEVLDLDARCDVFGLGALLCVILTGKPPYVADDPRDLMLKAVDGDLTDALERLDKCRAEQGLIQICKMCLAADRNDRYRDGGALAQAIADHREAVRERLHQAELHRAQLEVKTATETTRRRLLLGLSMSIIVLIAVAGMASLWLQHQQSVRQYEQQQRQAIESIRLSRTISTTKNTVVQIYDHVRKGQFIAADILLKQAQLRLIDAHHGESYKLLSQAEQDLSTAAALDQARMQKASGTRRVAVNLAGKAYAEIFFDEAKIINKTMTAAEAAAVISKSKIKQQLLAALDDWSDAVYNPATQERLLEIARRADPHPVRDQFRRIASRNNAETMRALVQKTDISKLSPGLLTAVASRLMKSRKGAVALLHRAVALHPNDFWLSFQLGLALHSENPGKAAEYYRVALANRPNALGVVNNLSDVLQKSRRFDEALGLSRRAVNIAPNDPGLHANLGEVFRQLKQTKAAVAAYEKALALIGSNEVKYASARRQALTGLGNVFLGEKNYDKAIGYYKHAHDAQPWHEHPLLNQGIAYQRKGALRKAIGVYRELVRRHPKSRDAQLALGSALYDTSDYQGAADAYRQLVVNNPNDVDGWSGILMACGKDGKFDEAAIAGRKAISLRPYHAWNHYRLGVTYQRQKNHGQAIVVLRRAVSLQSELSRAWAALGHSLRETGQFQESRRAFQQALQTTPANQSDRKKNLRNHLSWAERLAEFDGRLLMYFQEPASLKNRREVLDLAAFCRRNKKLPKTAVKLYQRGFDIRVPNNPQRKLYFHAATAAVQSAGAGDDRHRREMLDQALAWLEKGLRLWESHTRKTGDAKAMKKSLRHWRVAAEFSAVRDADALKKLPKPEQDNWRQFWRKIDGALEE